MLRLVTTSNDQKNAHSNVNIMFQLFPSQKNALIDYGMN